MDPSTNISEGGCSGIPTVVEMPIVRSLIPCKQLKDISEKDKFKQQMTELKNNIPTGTEEKGFTINGIAGNEFTSVVQGGAAKGGVKHPYETMPLDQLYQTYGTAHNHLENNPEHIGIFTIEDIGNLYFNGLFETAAANPYRVDVPAKAVIFVITNRGYFALKINDFTKLTTFAKWYSDMVISDITYGTEKQKEYIKDQFSNPEKYNITPTATHDQTVIGFLRYIKDKNIGIDLYEGNKDTYGSWKKLTLKTNADGTYSYNQEPCPL